MSAVVPKKQSRGVPRVLLGGGIGAGKSAVAEVFEREGFLSISADDVGRSVLEPGSEAVDRVADRWPDVVAEGVVDRLALAGVVFSDPDELAHLESITHPAIGDAIAHEISRNSDRSIVVEVPLIGLLSDVPFFRVAVVADERTRLARAISRGGDPDDVRNRMLSQPSDEGWRNWADVVVDNGGAWADTERTVLDVIASVVRDV